MCRCARGPRAPRDQTYGGALRSGVACICASCIARVCWVYLASGRWRLETARRICFVVCAVLVSRPHAVDGSLGLGRSCVTRVALQACVFIIHVKTRAARRVRVSRLGSRLGSRVALSRVSVGSADGSRVASRDASPGYGETSRADRISIMGKSHNAKYNTTKNAPAPTRKGKTKRPFEA